MFKKGIIAVFSLLFTSAVFAAFTEGTDYIKLPPEVKQQAVVQTFLAEDQGKIQVTEFFSYKCPGCYSLDAPFAAWAAKQPKDVAVRHVPVAFNEAWEPIAKTYYVLEELNEVARLNPVIFNALHKEGKRLDTQSEIAAFLAQHGVATKDFNAAYEGFNVNRKWAQAKLLREAEEVKSIPSVVVNAEYATHLGMSRDPAIMTQVLDELIEKSRKQN